MAIIILDKMVRVLENTTQQTYNPVLESLVHVESEKKSLLWLEATCDKLCYQKGKEKGTL